MSIGMTVIHLPWPPSTNGLWRAYRGRNILSARYRAWRDEAGKAALAQRPVKLRGPVAVRIELSSPTARGFDLDNYSKAPIDLLVTMGIIEADDSRTLRKLTVELGSSFTGARVHIEAAP